MSEANSSPAAKLAKLQVTKGDSQFLHSSLTFHMVEYQDTLLTV